MYRKRRSSVRHQTAKHRLRVTPWFLTTTATLCALVLLRAFFPRINSPGKNIKCINTPPVRVFVHLHKTAGNNLKIALTGFAKRNNLKLFHTCHAAEPDSWLKQWWFGRQKSLNGTDCNLDKFASLPRDERVAFDFVIGHQSIGAHSLVRPRKTQYFTFLRDPLHRKISHYAHFEASPALQTLIRTRAAGSVDSTNVTKRMMLRHALDIEQPRLARYLLNENRNYMVKRLAGEEAISEIESDLRGRLVDLSVFVGRAALRAAEKNLQNQFFFVGLQERYTEGLCVLSHILNNACYASLGEVQLQKKLRFQKIALSTVNRRETSRAIIQWLPDSLANAARIAEELDVRLYKFAEDLFEKQLTKYPQCKDELKLT